MAEGWTRHLRGDLIEAYSAGTQPAELNSRVVRVMGEAGVDISGHRPKAVDEIKDIAFDYVVTVCDNAREQCPFFPARVKVVHVGFEDPPRLAAEAATEADALDCYRRVRDQIKAFVEKLPQALEQDSRDS
jgi:arsenate reductase